MKKLVSSIIVVILLVSLLAGCVRDSSDEPDRSTDDTQSGGSSTTGFVFDSLDHVYLTEEIPFPEFDGYRTNSGNVVLAKDKIWFTTWGETDESDTSNMNGLFSMDVDGTGLTELPDYLPGSFPPEITNGYVHIFSLFVDKEGYLWIIEARGAEDFDFPDGFDTYVLRKLDMTGAEISIFDLSELATTNEYFYAHSLSVDGAGNIYIASQADIYVLNDRGELLFTLNNPEEWNANFVLMSDGIIALTVQQGSDVFLRVIDVENKTWGETINIPANIMFMHNVYSGAGQYYYFYNAGGALNGVVTETGEHEKLISWVDIAMSSGDINGIMLMTDGRIIVTRQRFISGSIETELVLLTHTSIDDIPDRTILKLATFWFGSDLRYVVEQFNRKSTTHRIDVTDYSAFSTDDDPGGGRLRLAAEMITGNSPDILYMWSLQVQNYVSKDLLVDFYPYLDNDPDLGRDSMVQSVLKASEINGSLYRLIPSFRLATIYGNPSVLGDYPGWTAKEFLDVLNANPQADRPMGHHGSKMGFLSIMINNNMDEYVDWQSGTANFESDSFIELLKLANTYPDEIDYNTSKYHAIPEGRQIIDGDSIGMLDYQVARVLFGGEIVLKGFPMENRDGNILLPWDNIAITTNCKEPDVAWEFVRMFLMEDFQRNVLFDANFPINKVVFEEVINKKVVGSIGAGDGIGELMIEGPDMNLTEEEIDILRNAINNATRLRSDDFTIWNLVSESASDFFGGRNTAEVAARIIQNRVSIYLAEQAG